MNIYIVCRRYCIGEAWTNRILAYAKGLSEHGCNVSLVYLISDSNRTPYTISISNVKVINLWEEDCWLAKHCRVLSYLFNLNKLKKLIKKNDKVFVYNAEYLILRTVLRTKGNSYVEITEHPYIYNTDGLKGQKRIDHSSSRLKVVDGLSVISYSLKDYYESIGVPSYKIAVVNMFVDIERFRNVHKLDNEPYIAYCGVISRKKDGVHNLLSSFKLFHLEYPDYKLYIIGRGESPSIIEELKKYCYNEGILESVVFTGKVEPDRIPELLVNARILALARPDNLQSQNGFPTKLGEYLATGNPIVVTSVGEIPNYIHHMENGILAEPDNILDFTEKLLWVERNYEKAKEIGLQGRLLAQNCFSYKSQSLVLFNLMNK